MQKLVIRDFKKAYPEIDYYDDKNLMQPMELAGYTGFTEDEVKELCDRYDMSYDEVSNLHDGYFPTF